MDTGNPEGGALTHELAVAAYFTFLGRKFILLSSTKKEDFSWLAQPVRKCHNSTNKKPSLP